MGNKGKTVVGLLAVCLLVGGLGAVTKGFREWNPTNWFGTKKPDDIGVDVKGNGIRIKGLNTSKQVDGTFKTTFTYSVTPANATDQTITLSALYADGSDCADVITMSVSGNTVTLITSKHGFGKQIVVTLTANANAEATASVTLDSAKRLESVDVKDTLFLVGPAKGSITTSLTEVDDFALENFVNLTYTAFTIDRELNPYFDETGNLSYVKMGMQMEGELSEAGLYGEVTGVLSGALRTAVKTKLVAGGSYFTADELWGMDDSNAWHSFLKEYSGGSTQTNYVQYAFSGVVVNDVYPSALEAAFSMNLSLNFDFTDDAKYPVGVDSLAPESANITVL